MRDREQLTPFRAGSCPERRPVWHTPRRFAARAGEPWLRCGFALMSNRREREAAKTGGRDAPHIGQVAIWPRDYVRPEAIAPRGFARCKTTELRREASPIAEDKQYGRKASPRPRRRK